MSRTGRREHHLCSSLDAAQCGARKDVREGGPDPEHRLWHRLEHSRTSQPSLSKKIQPLPRAADRYPMVWVNALVTDGAQSSSCEHLCLVRPWLSKERGWDSCSALRTRLWVTNSFHDFWQESQSFEFLLSHHGDNRLVAGGVSHWEHRRTWGSRLQGPGPQESSLPGRRPK